MVPPNPFGDSGPAVLPDPKLTPFVYNGSDADVNATVSVMFNANSTLNIAATTSSLNQLRTKWYLSPFLPGVGVPAAIHIPASPPSVVRVAAHVDEDGAATYVKASATVAATNTALGVKGVVAAANGKALNVAVFGVPKPPVAAPKAAAVETAVNGTATAAAPKAAAAKNATTEA